MYSYVCYSIPPIIYHSVSVCHFSVCYFIIYCLLSIYLCSQYILNITYLSVCHLSPIPHTYIINLRVIYQLYHISTLIIYLPSSYIYLSACIYHYQLFIYLSPINLSINLSIHLSLSPTSLSFIYVYHL